MHHTALHHWLKFQTILNKFGEVMKHYWNIRRKLKTYLSHKPFGTHRKFFSSYSQKQEDIIIITITIIIVIVIIIII